VSISWGDVTAIAPELSTSSAATQTDILETVDLLIDDAVWGEFADKGRAYLAAHLGTIAGGSGGGGGGAGPVTEETIGPLSRSYATPEGVDGSLGSTKYGLFYKTLLRLAVAVPAMVP
jgi:hypothetical protein